MLPENIELEIVTPERHVLRRPCSGSKCPGKKATWAFCPGMRR